VRLPVRADGRQPPEPLRFQVVDLGFGKDAQVISLDASQQRVRLGECHDAIWVDRMSNRRVHRR
jgi:hypothetical protein